MIGMKRPTEKGASSQRPDSQADSLPGSQYEPSTHSEVRTKLDLARQFIDMGDPESARHMLREVLEEGDPTQQQEAQRLVDSLP
jgi:pilus assembly protein FimV